MRSNTIANPCTDKLTDLQYLEHMVPHHQVAVDMSVQLLQNNTMKNPTMHHLCRNIIRKQKYEIWEMNIMKQKLAQTVFYPTVGQPVCAKTKIEMYTPVMERAYCDPLFFKPDEHMHHMQSHTLTADGYLKHMIPHHQVAVDMSKRLLLHTKNSYLIDFCKRLIVDQQYEISTMKDLQQNTYVHQSELL